MNGNMSSDEICCQLAMPKEQMEHMIQMDTQVVCMLK